jgi:hypothetical protein
MTTALEEFFGTGNEVHPPALDGALRVVVENWQHDIAQGDQIGFLPRVTGGRLYWYGFAPTARRRREMLDLLDAWIGPTYSDLTQLRGALDLDDEFDVALTAMSCEPIKFEVLPWAMPGSRLAREKVREALINLSTLVKRRPLSEFDAPRTTVEVLDDLGHAIGAHDRDLALTCLRELEATADMDESNLAFLRLRVFAGLRDWSALLSDQALEHVLAMRRPLGVTRIIQQAIYHSRLDAVDREGSESELRRAADGLPHQFRALVSGAPTTSRAEVVVEFLIALNHSTDPNDPTLARLLSEAGHLEAGLDEHLRRVLRDGTRIAPEVELPSDEQHAQGPDHAATKSPEQQLADLWVAGEYSTAIDLGCQLDPNLHVARVLLVSARYLQSAESAARVEEYLTRHDLKAAISATGAVFRDDLAWLESFCTPNASVGWRAWFDGLDRAGPGGVTEAPPYNAAADWPPLEFDEFTALLEDAAEDVLGRLGECGGQFMAAHQAMFEMPGADTLAERVLASFALSQRASAGVRVQTLAMLEALGPASPTTTTFMSILEWTAEIVDCCASAISVSWAVDVLQAATIERVPDSLTAMQSFFYRVVDAVRPYRTALNVADLAALQVIAEELAVAVPEDLVTKQRDEHLEPGAPYLYLRDHIVVLYSLTESAIIRAAQVLRKLIPGIDVRTNSEHDGSSQLAALCSSADTFVVVTASAKHAATDFIAGHRGSRPMVLVNSRGSSAILRELART